MNIVIKPIIPMSAKEIIVQASSLLDSAKPEILGRIASTSRAVRERAIKALTNTLNVNSPEDTTVFYTMPLEFLKRNDPIGAVWYIETIGKLGNTFPWQVIDEVYSRTISDMDFQRLNDDEESFRVVSSSIEALFRMLQSHPVYANSPEFALMMGDFEEYKEKPYNAIEHYNTLIGQGYIEGYIAAARVYEELGRYDESIMILENGSFIYADAQILGKLVSVLCKMGRNREAVSKYQELREIDNTIPPFLVYKGSIENDTEMKLFEEIMAYYVAEGSCVPLESLGKLAQSASEYVSASFPLGEDLISTLLTRDPTEWTPEDIENIKQRLWLVQTDVLTLGNDRYLDYYMDILRVFGIEGDDFKRDILHNFFVEHSSKEAQLQREKRDNDNLTGALKYHPGSLFEDISVHVSRAGELFFHGSFYDIYTEKMIPLLRDSAVLSDEYDEDMEEDFIESVFVIKNKSDYYESLRPDTRENYENFIQQFDEKYGLCYRRQIQAIAIDINIKDSDYPPAFKAYPDIAFLFWIEKLLSCEIAVDDPDEIEKIVQEYSLFSINVLDGLLLGTLLFDLSPGYAVSFLVDFPHMLDSPQAIYIITEGLRSMGPKDRKETIQDLHEIARKEYAARGFFEHVKFIFSDIQTSEPTEIETEYMYLVNGNIAILQGKEPSQSITNFRLASKNGSTEGLFQAGDSYMNTGDFDRALLIFEQAFYQDDSVAVITKILECSILSGKYNVAQKYIDFAMRKGYDVRNYILALHLWKENTRPALLQGIAMIRDKVDILDMPEGMLSRYFQTLNDIMDMPDSVDSEEKELKVLTSFIVCNVIVNGKIPGVETYAAHWAYITSLCTSASSENLHAKIRSSLEPIVGDMFDLLPENASIGLLETHAQNIFETMKIRLKESQEKGDVVAGEKIAHTMNIFFAMVITLLVKFPGTESYVAKWRSAIGFTTPLDVIIHDMPNQVH